MQLTKGALFFWNFAGGMRCPTSLLQGPLPQCLPYTLLHQWSSSSPVSKVKDPEILLPDPAVFPLAWEVNSAHFGCVVGTRSLSFHCQDNPGIAHRPGAKHLKSFWPAKDFLGFDGSWTGAFRVVDVGYVYRRCRSQHNRSALLPGKVPLWPSPCPPLPIPSCMLLLLVLCPSSESRNQCSL